jgi:hypothetical protein
VSGGPPEARADGCAARARAGAGADGAGGLRWTAQALLVQKAGNTPEEMEDACFPSREADGAAGGARFAVADGATETSFSGLWASTLVRLHGRVGLAAETLLDGLPRWGRYWRRRVGERDLPWYAEEKLRSGSFAAFAGLTLGVPADGAPAAGGGRLPWEAVAAGDSCVFQVREDTLLVAFPLDSAADFGNRPALISTEPAANAGLGSHLRRADGECRAGDTFYLMTDALAAWFLAAAERGERPWLALDALAGGSPAGESAAEPGGGPGGGPAGAAEPSEGADAAGATFRAWVDAARRERRMRNDDVALLRVALW